jgi:adenylate kinase
MGHLIREAKESGNGTFVKAYEEYSLKGMHLPTAIKFPLLREKMDRAKSGFILDNFPATKDDLEALNNYLSKTNKRINKVIYLSIPQEEMQKRFKNAFRNRKDDHPKVITARKEIQDQDRIPVLEFYKSQNVLLEINGVGDVNKIHEEILKELSKNSN